MEFDSLFWSFSAVAVMVGVVIGAGLTLFLASPIRKAKLKNALQKKNLGVDFLRCRSGLMRMLIVDYGQPSFKYNGGDYQLKTEAQFWHEGLTASAHEEGNPEPLKHFTVSVALDAATNERYLLRMKQAFASLAGALAGDLTKNLDLITILAGAAVFVGIVAVVTGFLGLQAAQAAQDAALNCTIAVGKLASVGMVGH